MLSRTFTPLRMTIRSSLYQQSRFCFSAAPGPNAVHDSISEIVSANDVAIFMKGTRKMPRCGFSNYVTQILKFYNVKEWKDVNCLEDDALREGIKTFSNWPTIP